ncbi:solute carrier family 25 member 38 [Hysterangium stoloniferum]|nr:solute carrier family 25 member 38 [Hysterangium stoloniferum]
MSYSQHLASGALSGLTSVICLQPFDLLKTRMQQGYDTSHHLQGRVPGIISIARNVVDTHGVFGLWRGTLPTLARNVPGVALYMSTLNQVRVVMAGTTYFTKMRPASGSSSSVLPSLTLQGNLLAGAVTRSAVGTLLNPLAILKARYESDLYAYRSLWEAFSSLIKSGPSQLFRGAAASVMRDAPYAGLFLMTYEHLKHESGILFNPLTNSSMIVINGFAGAGAGTAATLLTHPFDVLKTRLQVRNGDKYHTLRSTVRTIWTDRGLRGFFDGISLRLSRKVLSSAIGWAVYEGTLLFIHNRTRLRPAVA